VSKNSIRITIVALAAGTFGLVSVAGPAQALAGTGSTQASTQLSATVSGGISVGISGSVTLPAVNPNDSSWD
jgi:hypothetical protein